MNIHVINLDRSPERLTQFKARNARIPGIQRFSAADGSTVDREALVQAHTIAPGLAYSAGAIGCALSHLCFWNAAAAENRMFTVCEDDAIFNRRFPDLAPRLIAELPGDWDLVLWGWNMDSILMFDLMPGISPCLARFDQEQMRGAVEDFQTRALAPRPFPLLRAFGIPCYSVSPAGARKLLREALPLRPFTLDFPTVGKALPNDGIDIVMNSLYPKLKAYVSLPPLVITRNEFAFSTVQQRR